MTIHGLDEGRFEQVDCHQTQLSNDQNRQNDSRSVIKNRALRERQPDHPIVPLLYARWSPRAMTGEEISKEEFCSLLEAARWAPSTYNEQEWRYLYAHRKTSEWSLFFDVLMEANQTWCKNASTLIAIVGKDNLSKGAQKENPVRSFDCGASFQNMALQGVEMGLVVHGMAGFDAAKLAENLRVPGDYSVEAMVSIGRPAPAATLPSELAERENPSHRKPIEEFMCEGKFRW